MNCHQNQDKLLHACYPSKAWSVTRKRCLVCSKGDFFLCRIQWVKWLTGIGLKLHWQRSPEQLGRPLMIARLFVTWCTGCCILRVFFRCSDGEECWHVIMDSADICVWGSPLDGLLDIYKYLVQRESTYDNFPVICRMASQYIVTVKWSLTQMVASLVHSYYWIDMYHFKIL